MCHGVSELSASAGPARPLVGTTSADFRTSDSVRFLLTIVEVTWSSRHPGGQGLGHLGVLTTDVGDADLLDMWRTSE